MTQVLGMVVAVALLVVVPTIVVLVVQERARRRQRRAIVDKAMRDVAVDLHSESYAETGIALAAPGEAVDDRIRAEAARDAAGAAFVTPGRRLADAFLAELFPRSKGVGP